MHAPEQQMLDPVGSEENLSRAAPMRPDTENSFGTNFEPPKAVSGFCGIIGITQDPVLCFGLSDSGLNPTYRVCSDRLVQKLELHMP